MVPYSESKIKAVKRRDLEVEPPPELRGGKKSISVVDSENSG